MKPLVLLQNAWSPLYAGDIWPRDSWLKALHRSRSGQRLSVAFPDPEAVWYDNTTPQVAEEPNGVMAPDLDHVRALLTQEPPFVVACGKQASAVARALWPGRLLVTPHPAYRLVTDELFRRLALEIARNTFGRMEFFQLRGAVAYNFIPTPAKETI